MDVILASQAHQVPQVGLPQIEPVTKAIILKTKPAGAKLFAINTKDLILKIIIEKDKIAITEKVPRDIQAEGHEHTLFLLNDFECNPLEKI